VGLEVIVNPAREHRRFHPRTPGVRKLFHPMVPIHTGDGNRSLDVNLAIAVFHAVADLPLVNIQPYVISRLHEGAALVFLNQRSLSSAFYTKSTYTFNLNKELLPGCRNNGSRLRSPQVLKKTPYKVLQPRLESKICGCLPVLPCRAKGKIGARS